MGFFIPVIIKINLNNVITARVIIKILIHNEWLRKYRVFEKFQNHKKNNLNMGDNKFPFYKNKSDCFRV